MSRTSIFSSIKTALTAASLTTSDLSSSSLPVTIKGVYNNNKDKRSLPVLVINKASIVPVDTPFFNSDKAFDSRREVHVLLDVYATKNTHIDQLSDQIDNYFTLNRVGGLSLIGFDEDDELQTPNSNLAHHKSLMLTFKLR